jgi:hypothetical protein
MIFLAQTDLPSVPSETLKWVLVIIVAFGLVGLAIYAALRKPEKTRTRLDDEPPINVRKAAPRFNHSLSEERHRDHDRRIAALELWRAELGPQMEKDRRELVKENEDRAARIHSHIEMDRRAMDQKIDGIFDRIIATLKNANLIGK